MYNNTMSNNTKKSTFYVFYIYFLIIVKTIFLISIVVLNYYEYKYKGTKSKETIVFIEDLKQFRERIDFVFMVGISCLLISLFNPWNKKSLIIDDNTKMLLYLFGVFNILIAPWTTFFYENKWFSDLMKFIGIKREDEYKNNNGNKFSYDNNIVSKYYNDSVYTGNIITQTPPPPKLEPVTQKKNLDKIL